MTGTIDYLINEVAQLNAELNEARRTINALHKALQLATAELPICDADMQEKEVS